MSVLLDLIHQAEELFADAGDPSEARKWVLRELLPFLRELEAMQHPESQSADGEQVLVRQRSQVMWDHGMATLELGSDDCIVITTGAIGPMRMRVIDAARLANVIGRLVQVASGGKGEPKFTPQRDCVHCQDDLVHTKHETPAELAQRGQALTNMLRAARQR